MNLNRKVTMFIAMSLDGYIAKADGRIDWLGGEEANMDDMISYTTFIKDIDTIIMGWNTYEQLTQELSPEQWVYPDHMTYVVTHREMKDSENIKFVNDNVSSIVHTLKQQEGKGIWICGGAGIIQPLLKDNAIDRYHINIMPIILGNGISLFNSMNTEIKLKLIETKQYNGITDVIYERRM